MVASVSPNCTSTAARRAVSSSFSLQAIAFAIAVIEAVSSHGFIFSSPFICSIVIYASISITEKGLPRRDSPSVFLAAAAATVVAVIAAAGADDENKENDPAAVASAK